MKNKRNLVSISSRCPRTGVFAPSLGAVVFVLIVPLPHTLAKAPQATVTLPKVVPGGNVRMENAEPTRDQRKSVGDAAAWKVISERSRHAQADLSQANLHLANRQRDRAEALYRRAISQDRTLVDAYVPLAGILEETGRIKEATAVWAEAAGNTANRTWWSSRRADSDTQFRYARFFHRRGRVADAMHAFRTAQKNTTNTSAYLVELPQRGPVSASVFHAAAETGIGLKLLYEGRVKEATPHFVEAQKLAPNYAPGYLFHGKAMEFGGSLRGAAAKYRLAERYGSPQVKDIAARLRRWVGDSDSPARP